MLYHTNYTTALMQVLALAGALEHLYQAVATNDQAYCDDVKVTVYRAQANKAQYAYDLINHIGAGGSVTVICVSFADALLGDIYVWMNEQGDIERAYPVQSYTA